MSADTSTTPATAGATLRITGEISARHFDDTGRAEVRVFPSFTVEWQQKIADELGVERDAVLRALVLAAPLLTHGRRHTLEDVAAEFGVDFNGDDIED